MKDRDDERAVEDIRKGGQWGAKFIFDKYGARSLKFIIKKYGFSIMDAEDALQNTLLRTFTSIRNGTYQYKAGIYTYMAAILHNECLRIFESNKRRSGVFSPPDRQSPQSDENFELTGKSFYAGAGNDGIPASDNLEKILCYRLCITSAVERFETKHKKTAEKCLQALTLQVEGRSILEIAKKIGRSERAAAVFLSECRKKLKPYLRPCQDDCDEL
ncbi:MAG: hypothetical protein GY862_15025 [Gammaproteobacteria bacterium]|nr:hypothetical protein [Gammaproteobacteria bacterium]